MTVRRWARARRPEAEAGFTLVEMVMATALLALVVGSMMTFFTSVQYSTVRSDTRGRATDDIRLAMERVTREIRQAQTIRTGSSASILDMDTFVNGTATHIIYTASGTTLTRNDGAHTLTILTGLTTTSLFTYVPNATTPSLISVTLSVKPAEFNTDTAAVSLTSDARLRN